jgi:hypothetical protein
MRKFYGAHCSHVANSWTTVGWFLVDQIGCFSFNFPKFFDHNAFEFLMLSPNCIYLNV